VLADESVWGQVATLRQEVEKDPQRLGVVRAELDPLEAQLWSMADEAVGRRRAGPSSQWRSTQRFGRCSGDSFPDGRIPDVVSVRRYAPRRYAHEGGAQWPSN